MVLEEIAQALELYVRPQTFPVAIRMIRSIDEVPEKTRMPKRDLGVLMPVCQAIALARRYGWVMAMGTEDMLCPLGALTLGLLPAKDKFLDGSFKIPFWVKDQGVRAKISQTLPRLEQGKYTYLIAAPIHRADFEPQVIVVYGNPAQVSRLIQAAIYGTGEAVSSSSSGGFACGEEVTRTILKNECQVVLTGGGDRAVAQAQDHEASFAMPASRAEAVVEGLERTHRAGMRYPTTPFLTCQYEFPQSFNDLMEYLKKGE
jgi:uncharacterized protein (DUF169 family)